MITQVQIPLAFENMEEATIGSWHISEGQSIAKDQPLCELITEKTTFDLPSPAAGLLRLIVLPTKSVAAVGEVICLIGGAEDALPNGSTDKSTFPPPKESTFMSAVKPNTHEAASSTASRLRATPAARRAAKERGVKLQDVALAFPDKVLSEEDVLKFTGDA